jgi:ATP dependent DNA ligase domain
MALRTVVSETPASAGVQAPCFATSQANKARARYWLAMASVARRARLIARCENGVVYLWSRTGRNWAKDFPAIGAAMARLPVKSVILDGEAVCLLEDGRPDFHALRSRHPCRDARLIAYDLLGLNGEDLCRSTTAANGWRAY